MPLRRLVSLLFLASLLGGATIAQAKYVSLQTFSWHDADAGILKLLGFDTATVLYFHEMASITSEQLKERRDYDRIGCMPYFIMKNGKIEEKGYHCKSFYCVGYQKGPKQCLNMQQEPYGGIVEIARRQSIITIKDIRKDFSKFPAEEQTTVMRNRINELSPIRCRPYYILYLDVIVGEGYACEEVGSYPYFSAANDCTDDWRDAVNGFTCKNEERDNEFEMRRLALNVQSNGSSSSSAVSSGSGTSSASSTVTSFPDVIAGHYGYTAIMDLVQRKVLRGYADGTFHPLNNVNRAEFLRILLGGLHPEEARDEKNCFPDVHDEWYSPYVCAGKRLGWVVGYRDGTYRPEQTIRRDEGLKIIIASLGLELDSPAPLPPDVVEGTWFTPYARKGIELGMMLEPTFRPMQLATRADAAVWMFRALRAQGKMKLSPMSEASE